MNFYIVYSYTHNSGNFPPTKYIEGIYKNIEEAKNRQTFICGEYTQSGINSTIHGNGKTTFINVIPEGGCHIELFTTPP